MLESKAESNQIERLLHYICSHTNIIINHMVPENNIQYSVSSKLSILYMINSVMSLLKLFVGNDGKGHAHKIFILKAGKM